jgi:hypothetical protein
MAPFEFYTAIYELERAIATERLKGVAQRRKECKTALQALMQGAVRFGAGAPLPRSIYSLTERIADESFHGNHLANPTPPNARWKSGAALDMIVSEQVTLFHHSLGQYQVLYQQAIAAQQTPTAPVPTMEPSWYVQPTISLHLFQAGFAVSRTTHTGEPSLRSTRSPHRTLLTPVLLRRRSVCRPGLS